MTFAKTFRQRLAALWVAMLTALARLLNAAAPAAGRLYVKAMQAAFPKPISQAERWIISAPWGMLVALLLTNWAAPQSIAGNLTAWMMVAGFMCYLSGIVALMVKGEKLFSHGLTPRELLLFGLPQALLLLAWSFIHSLTPSQFAVFGFAVGTAPLAFAAVHVLRNPPELRLQFVLARMPSKAEIAALSAAGAFWRPLYD